MLIKESSESNKPHDSKDLNLNNQIKETSKNCNKPKFNEPFINNIEDEKEYQLTNEHPVLIIFFMKSILTF